MAFALGLGLLSAVLWFKDRDLRDLDALVRVQAEVVDVDSKRRSADVLELRYVVQDRVFEVGVPSTVDAGVGDRIAVAHVPDEPDRVRTVEGWAPVASSWTAYALMLAVVGAALAAFGRWSRARPRYEDGAVPPAPEADRLGLRVVRSSAWPAWATAGTGVVLGGLLVAKGMADPSDVEAWWGAGILFGVLALTAVAMHWYSGRDGVWDAGSELVTRRRGRVRRWPWDQVRALGTVTDGGRAVAAAARLDDGDDDGIGADGWVTLVRPVAGPLASHRDHGRLRALAQQRGLPFVDGLTGEDLADTVHGNLQYRLRSR